MKEDIRFCKDHGVKGVVFGILKKDGTIDIDRCANLVELARPMQVTFHRAFDRARHPFQAMEEIIRLGIDRMLTSGQAQNVIEGAGIIADLIDRAEDRIIIMPGSGVTENNVSALIKMTGAKEVHASLRSPVKSGMNYRENSASMGKPGQDEFTWMETDPARVRAVVNILG
jgi:copper homeostasis protein